MPTHTIAPAKPRNTVSVSGADTACGRTKPQRTRVTMINTIARKYSRKKLPISIRTPNKKPTTQSGLTGKSFQRTNYDLLIGRTWICIVLVTLPDASVAVATASPEVRPLMTAELLPLAVTVATAGLSTVHLTALLVALSG